MRIRRTWAALLAFSMGSVLPPAARTQIHPHHAEEIRKAAKEVKPRGAPKKPRTVLIWNTPPHLMDKDPHKGYCIPYGEEGLKAIGEASGAFEPILSDDIAMYAPENILRFDAIVLNNTSGAWITPTEADMAKPALKRCGADAGEAETVLRKSFLDFIENGGGAVCLHFAIAANSHWPEFKELFGATFTGHPWTEEVGVTVEEPSHPLVAAFGGRDFRIADEIYQYGAPYDRSRLRVLMSLDPGTTNMGVRWRDRKQTDFALTWVKSRGKGRIFNTSFGHMANLYSNPRVLQFYLDAIQFAAGDLEAPTAPRESRPITRRVPGTEPVPGLEGFCSLFDGKTLDGWEGDRAIWSVRDGALTGETKADTGLRENSFLLWKDQVEDFELRLKFKLENGNSGIYYRARKRPAGQTGGDPLVGSQADFDASGRWTGVIMEYLLRDVLAERGWKVVIDEQGKKQATPLGDPTQLLAAVKPGEWNDYRVVARGGGVKLEINGVTMCELDDRDPKRLAHGWLAVQVHVGPPMRVQFKDIWLRRL